MKLCYLLVAHNVIELLSWIWSCLSTKSPKNHSISFNFVFHSFKNVLIPGSPSFASVQLLWGDRIETSNKLRTMFNEYLVVGFFARSPGASNALDAVNFHYGNTKTFYWLNKSSLSIKWTWIIVLDSRPNKEQYESKKWKQRKPAPAPSTKRMALQKRWPFLTRILAKSHYLLLSNHAP